MFDFVITLELEKCLKSRKFIKILCVGCKTVLNYSSTNTLHMVQMRMW